MAGYKVIRTKIVENKSGTIAGSVGKIGVYIELDSGMKAWGFANTAEIAEKSAVKNALAVK